MLSHLRKASITFLLSLLSILCKSQSFAVIGDFGLDGENEKRVSELVKSWNPEFILTLGDNNYPRGEEETIDDNIGKYYSDFIHPYKGKYGEGAKKNRFYPCLGNHDVYLGEPTPYFDYFKLSNNERYYDFIKGNIHFFALNSNDNEPDGITYDSQQAQWLKEKLKASTSIWKIVFFHHPPFCSGPHGNCSKLQWPFKEWGVDIIMAGHEHLYERLNVNGKYYFVNGLGGADPYDFMKDEEDSPNSQFRYNEDVGAMKVNASIDKLNIQFINAKNELIDETIIKKNKNDFFDSNELIELCFDTNLKKLINDEDEEPQYHPAELLYHLPNTALKKIPVNLKHRGNFRRSKENCNFPPLTLKLNETDTKGTLFENIHKLKIVNPCNINNPSYQQYIYQEYLAYRVYNLITDSSFRVRPAIINYKGKESDTIKIFSFLIEGYDHVAARLGVKEVDTIPLYDTTPDLNQPPYGEIFQYMIGNKDWYYPDHNVRLFSNLEQGDTIIFPYDFDLSVLVDAEYSHLKLDRSYRGFCRSKKEFEEAFQRFNNAHDKIIALYNNFPYLDKETKKKTLIYFDEFYKIINDSSKRQKEIYNQCSTDF